MLVDDLHKTGETANLHSSVGDLQVVLCICQCSRSKPHVEILTVTVFPAGGIFASKSVAMLKPELQQALVRGPFVQAESATRDEVVVACRFVRSTYLTTLLGGAAIEAPVIARTHMANDLKTPIFVGWYTSRGGLVTAQEIMIVERD